MSIKIINVNFHFNKSDMKNNHMENNDIIILHNMPISILKYYHKKYLDNNEYIFIINQITIYENYYSATVIKKNIYNRHSFPSNKTILINVSNRLVLLYYIPKHIDKSKHIKNDKIINQLLCKNPNKKIVTIYKNITQPNKNYRSYSIKKFVI